MLDVWLFFFFKQKTAYEMRISDWSSDVCSSDLDAATHPASASAVTPITAMSNRFAIVGRPTACPCRSNQLRVKAGMIRPSMIEISIRISAKPIRIPSARSRSEEHTSELQSLMRTSYAISCWKKKSTDQKHVTNDK